MQGESSEPESQVGRTCPEPQLQHQQHRDNPFGQASSLADFGSIVLSTSDPLFKSQLSHMAYSVWRRHNLSPRPTPNPPFAHVELNAIDLAWDTVVRFSPYIEILGEGFFADFAHVADDESRHFSWSAQWLAELGFKYGDMPAHNLQWRECEKSSDNFTARLTVKPLVQESRGLDSEPRLVKKIVGFGDNRTSKIVARIADEEVAHVSNLLKEYNVELKGPFNYSARDEAGIPRDWYDDASSASTKDKKDKYGNQKQLSAVYYERQASIIAMETENSSLTKSLE